MGECNVCKGRMRLYRRERPDGRLKEIHKCVDCGRIRVTVYPPDPEPMGA